MSLDYEISLYIQHFIVWNTNYRNWAIPLSAFLCQWKNLDLTHVFIIRLPQAAFVTIKPNNSAQTKLAS